MNEQQALARMVAPGTRRPGKFRDGVIQIHVTRACDMACYGCTQGSNLAGKTSFITPELFAQAVLSLKNYWGVVGLFGGNPALSPHFGSYCDILKKHVPYEQRGIWCNHPRGKGKLMRETFNPAVSNLNVHLSQEAYNEFKQDWPECGPVGLTTDSRHSPPYVALKDVVADEGKRWQLISGCDINHHWSAMMAMFRGQLRAWFCEIAGAQSILHQDNPSYPDTGLDPTLVYQQYGKQWWEFTMPFYRDQVRKHCHDCGVPLRGHGELAQADDGKGVEQVSNTHKDIYRPKRASRRVELVTVQSQLGNPLYRVIDYLGNSKV